MSASAWPAWKTIGPACSSDATCSTCSLPPLSRFARVVGQQPVDEAVRLLGVRVDRAGRAAAVLDDVDVAELVVLDALEAALAEHAPEVRDLRRVVERRLDDAAAGAALGGEEQALRERIPGRAVDHGHGRLAVGLGLGELRHAVRRIGVEVDARDVGAGGRAELVALVEEVRAVVVLRIGAVLALDDEVGVLVRLALRRLDVVARGLHVARRRNHRPVVVVAVPARQRRRVLERGRALRHRRLAPLRRELVGQRDARGLRVGGAGVGDRRSIRERRGAEHCDCSQRRHDPCHPNLVYGHERSLPGWTCGDGQRRAPARSMSP